MKKRLPENLKKVVWWELFWRFNAIFLIGIGLIIYGIINLERGIMSLGVIILGVVLSLIGITRAKHALKKFKE